MPRGDSSGLTGRPGVGQPCEAKLGRRASGGGSAGTKLGVGRKGAYAGATAVRARLGTRLGTAVARLPLPTLLALPTLLTLVSVCVMTVMPACTRVDTAPLPPDSDGNTTESKSLRWSA